MPVLRADSTGTCAIYDGPDDAPFSDRLGNINRLYFHSDAPAPYVVQSQTGTFTIPATTARSAVVKRTLFAHGLSYTPLVFGAWRKDSLSNPNNVPINEEPGYAPNGQVFQAVGSVPLAMWNNSNRNRQFGVWIHLAADATNVYAVVTQMKFYLSGFAGTRQFNMTYFCEVMSTALAGTPPSVATGKTMEITATRLEMGNGAFDSARRYVRRALPYNYALSDGKTIDITGNATRIGVRYNFDGYTEQAYFPSDPGYAVAPTSTFVGTKRDVKI